ncbi:TonB-dependent receptor [Thalassotalea psychrophila]|uniref:TonB-dependent receptor n=1 Tax=Thalassotalea psychrophila TaxID=3065647 RepID=A0ABY9TQM4_9GAMM|nr:TonB-dependent receptor [Colwelliaceae bacterium SQ149]
MSLQIIQENSSANFRKHLIAQTVAAALAVTSFASFSAEEASVEKEDLDDVIVVTAQKRTQNVMKVPVTVDSISAETIKQSGSIMLSDIDKFIPGFEFGDGDVTQAGVTMRGVSSPNISVGGDPSTATFFDGVYMPRAAQNVLFSDMQRVEVLKGPQGTLFGKNAAMGVVNMIPNAPQEEFEGFIKGTAGTDNLQRIEGMVNFGITDNVYVRINALTNTQEGFADNVADSPLNTGEKVWDDGEKDHQAARIAVKWDVSSRTNVQVSYDWDKLDQGPGGAIGLSEYAENPQDPFADTFANDVVNGGESRDMTATTLKVEHEFNDQWSMKLISSFREWETNNRIDEDGTQDITRYLDTDNHEDSDIFYNELQINYNTDSFNYVGGLTYSKENVHQTTFINTTTDTVTRLLSTEFNGQIEAGVREEISGAIGIAPEDIPDSFVDQTMQSLGLPLEHTWNAEQWVSALEVMGEADNIMAYLASLGMVPAGTPMTADFVRATGDVTYDVASIGLGVAEIFGPSYTGQMWSENFINNGEFTSYGIYSDFDFQLTDQWNVFFGVRYSEDDKDFSWEVTETQFAEVRPGVSNVLFPARDELWQSNSWSKTTGRVGTGYQINDDHMVFASVATGYKAGGFDSLASPHSESDGSIIIDPETGDVVDVSFEPEESVNIELGYKGILSDSLRTTFSMFHNILDDQQTSRSSKQPDQAQALPTIVNQDVEIDGFELGMDWQVTETFATGFVTEVRSTDTESDEFYNDSGTLIPAGSSSSDTNTSYTLKADWIPDLGFGTTIIHVDYVFRENARGAIIGEDEWVNDIPHYFDDTELLNARISWISDSDSIEIGLWGKNLMDNRYSGGPGGRTKDILGTGYTSVNRGMEAGVDVKYSF